MSILQFPRIVIIDSTELNQLFELLKSFYFLCVFVIFGYICPYVIDFIDDSRLYKRF